MMSEIQKLYLSSLGEGGKNFVVEHYAEGMAGH